MSGPCETCNFYRVPRPVSDALLANVGGVRDQATHEVNKTMTQTDVERTAKEASYLTSDSDENLGSKRTGLWPFRPRMTPYCGRHESDGVYAIASKKNAGLRCTDHRPGPPPYRPCRTCVHRVTAPGDAIDAFVIQSLGGPRFGKDLQIQPGDSGMANRVWADGAARTAGEVSAAYFADGHLTRQPKYLDWCRRFSRPYSSDYLACAAVNADHLCGEWARFSYGQ